MPALLIIWRLNWRFRLLEPVFQLESVYNDHATVADVLNSPYWKPMKERRFSVVVPRSTDPLARTTLIETPSEQDTSTFRDNVVRPLEVVERRSISAIVVVCWLDGLYDCSWT